MSLKVKDIYIFTSKVDAMKYLAVMHTLRVRDTFMRVTNQTFNRTSKTSKEATQAISQYD